MINMSESELELESGSPEHFSDFIVLRRTCLKHFEEFRIYKNEFEAIRAKMKEVESGKSDKHYP